MNCILGCWFVLWFVCIVGIMYIMIIDIIGCIGNFVVVVSFDWFCYGFLKGNL